MTEHLYNSPSAVDWKRLLVGPMPVNEGSEYALCLCGCCYSSLKSISILVSKKRSHHQESHTGAPREQGNRGSHLTNTDLQNCSEDNQVQWYFHILYRYPKGWVN